VSPVFLVPWKSGDGVGGPEDVPRDDHYGMQSSQEHSKDVHCEKGC
jgi:hypothetical protein